MSAALQAAREAVIKAAVALVYDGMSDAGWHSIKRAVLAMEAAASALEDALPREMARVRDHVLPHYVEIGSVGAFGAAMIRQDLDAAARALAEGDLAAISAAFQTLKGTNA